MSIVPLTQASHRLGIDVKTLRRWLAEASLSLHPDPQDARKKGVRVEHLHLLANQHQRSLATFSPAPSTLAAASPALLPTAVLALPETLNALQAQITALQQQIATLTHLLTCQPTQPATPAVQPSKTRKHSSRPAPPTPKTPPSAKALSKPIHVIPRVEYRADGSYVVICPKKGLLPLEPDTDAWFAWVREQGSFRFVGRSGHFTAHHEWRVPKGAWRAHRHIRNHNHTVRLAPNEDLTLAVLEHAAETLQARLS